MAVRHQAAVYRWALRRIGDAPVADARPSDVVAPAVRTGCPIYVSSEVFDPAETPLSDDQSLHNGRGAAAIVEQMRGEGERRRRGLDVSGTTIGEREEAENQRALHALFGDKAGNGSVDR